MTSAARDGVDRKAVIMRAITSFETPRLNFVDPVHAPLSSAWEQCKFNGAGRNNAAFKYVYTNRLFRSVYLRIGFSNQPILSDQKKATIRWQAIG